MAKSQNVISFSSNLQKMHKTTVQLINILQEKLMDTLISDYGTKMKIPSKIFSLLIIRRSQDQEQMWKKSIFKL